jgi:hypothetical protein
VYVGTPLNNASGAIKIQTGTYAGVGKDGSANPNSLTFDLDPKLVFIAQENGEGFAILPAYKYTGAYLQYAYVYGSDFKQGSAYYAKKDGTTVSWYSSAAASQMNVNTMTYHWIAIG